MSYARTLDRVETYFDRTATKVWDQLTSDAPVSRVRATVRAGRDEMRATMIEALGDVRGKRILDAGCGTGAASEVLAILGAEVVGVDISPSLIDIAKDRLPKGLRGKVHFEAGDMLADRGRFDAVLAMDSLIYYTARDLEAALLALGEKAPEVVFTIAPRSPFLMAFWYAGKLFPRRDRSPVMVPQDIARLEAAGLGIRHVKTVRSGFYTSACLKMVSRGQKGAGGPMEGGRDG
ncbi:MAG: magnesium protoporphyrin IX methyltransferase [Pseudomonadota bacterium]